MSERESVRKEDIAIIGMSGRFPGADDIRVFWNNLKNEIESVSTFTDAELLASGLDEETIKDPDYIRRRGIVEDALKFDARFFDFIPRDAEILDPQHRVFLECCWHAFEDAGYIPDEYPGQVAVYGGTGTNWHLFKANTNEEVVKNATGATIVTNNDKDYVTTRVSYKLGLTGPSIDIQTACSTALVSVIQGVNSLLSGDVDLAVAGGASIDTPIKRGYRYQKGGMESADGRCYSFDSRANGTVFSRGAGVVILKRLEDAVRDGDHIYSVIKGGAVNNDGSLKPGFTAPSIDGQIEVANLTFKKAGVCSDSISFVEAHGTATPLGDPIEFTSLSSSFREQTDKTNYCYLGTVKSNIGHTDIASGAAALIKASMALENGVLPATINYKEPNPEIEFEGSPFVIADKTQPIPVSSTPRRALINSFGVGGTNACVIIEEPPRLTSDAPQFNLLFPFSARSDTSLDNYIKKFREFVSDNPDMNLGDLAYTLQVGRKPMSHSTYVVASNRNDLLEKLESSLPTVANDEKSDKVPVFMFPGQGNQYLNMAKSLYYQYTVFKDALDQCCAVIDRIIGRSLRDIIFEEDSHDDASIINKTCYTQPALFAVEYALSQLWAALGVHPQVMIGHSVGEYVAAVLAGVMSVEDGAMAVATRGKLVQSLDEGSMLAVLLGHDEVVERLKGTRVDIAAFNYPSLVVVAGSNEDIAKFQSELEEEGIFCKHLDTSHAFHSWMMEPILADFREAMSKVELHAPTIPFVSTLTGTWITPEQATDTEYWVSHVRQPVLFSTAVSTLLEEEEQFVFLEVGPGRSLESAVKQHLSPQQTYSVIASLPTARESHLTQETFIAAIGALWGSGVPISWSDFYDEEQRLRISAPGYQFDRTEFKLPVVKSHEGAALGASLKALKAKQKSVADWFYIPSWTGTAPARYLARDTLEDHENKAWLIFSNGDSLSQAIIHQLNENGQNAIEVVKGDALSLDQKRWSINADRPEDYKDIFAAVAEKGLSVERIIYLWNVDQQALPFADDYHAYQANGFYYPVYLLQAVLDAGLLDNQHIVFCSNGAVSVSGENILHPEHALLNGPSRVLYREYGEIDTHVVDLDLSIKDERLAQLIIDECQIKTNAEIVALRGRYRWQESFESVKLEHDSADKRQEELTIKPNGRYLITGGLGGLGLLTANHLADTANVELLLTYRSALPEREQWDTWIKEHPIDDATSEKLANIIRLEDKGSTVQLLQVDVCDYEGMKSALAPYSHIDGVFHTAGIAGGGIIPLKKDEEAAKVLNSKVIGSLILDELLTDRGTHLFVFFSSITAIVGDAARVDYCSGNAFMDAFAHYRNQHRPGYSTSINWGKWGDIGMAVRYTKEQAVIDDERLGRTEGHPVKVGKLLTQLGCSTLGKEVFVLNINVGEDWVLDEHLISKQASMVGTTLLGALNEYCTFFHPDEDLQVTNLLFSSPVIYDHGWKREVQLIVYTEPEGISFNLQSRSVGEVDWQQHAQGSIGLSEQSKDPDTTPAALIESLSGPETLSPISTIHKDGTVKDIDFILNYSKRWDSIQQGWRSEDNAIFLFYQKLDDDYVHDFERFDYHPAMVDSLGMYTFRQLTEAPYLPLGYGRITFHAPIPQEIYTIVKFSHPFDENDPIVYLDYTLYDVHGNKLLTAENYSLIKVNGNPDGSASQNVNSNAKPRDAVVDLTDKDILYDEGWDALTRQLENPDLSQVIVVTSDLGQMIRESWPDTPEDEDDDDGQPTEGYSRPKLSSEYVEPTTELEIEVAKIWQSILGISGIGLNDSFTELGGNSLLAVQVVAMTSEEFGVDIRVDLFYQNDTLSGLVDIIATELEALV